MPHETGASKRLNLLFHTLLSGGGPDPADTLDRISHILTPERGGVGLRQFSRLLREAGSLTTEASLHAACVMHIGGMPAHRIVQFLSLSLSGGIRLSQFELAVRFMFGSAPHLPDNLLYDLTQYTYLEMRLLVQRSVELSGRLSRSVTPEMLLYLYLLSLREDLSNENVHLILLILKICFPALKIPRTARGVSPAEENEIAEAWKNAEQSARYAEVLGTPPWRASGRDREAHESASFFLDKYFADGALGLTAGPGRVAGLGTDAPTTAWTASVGAAETEPGTAPGAAGTGRAGTAARTRPAAGARKRAVPADRRAGVSVGRGAPPSLKPRRRIAAPVPASSSSPFPSRGGVTFGRLRLAAPFGLAAVLFLAFAVADHRTLRGAQTPVASPPAASLRQAETPRPGNRPASLSASHLVQKGDNLWKIYRSLHSKGVLDTEWKDFLLRVTERNGLRDPDAIFPGNVLTITTGKK